MKKELSSGISRILSFIRKCRSIHQGKCQLPQAGVCAIEEGLSEKQDLKANLSKIMEHYIAGREALGWPVSSAKKDELAKKGRQALESL